MTILYVVLIFIHYYRACYCNVARTLAYVYTLRWDITVYSYSYIDTVHATVK
jgi:hypothetical protein